MIIRLFLILLTFSFQAFSQESLEGSIYFGIEDDFDGKELREFVDFKDFETGKVSELKFRNGKIPQKIRDMKSGTAFKFRGSKKGREDIVEYDGYLGQSDITPMDDLTSVPKVFGAGSRSAIVVRVNLIDQGQYECNSEADLQSRIFSSSNPTSGANIYKDNSYGNFSFSGKVVTINVQKRVSDYTCSNSDLIKLSNDANVALMAKGINPLDYDYQQYYIPSNIPCGFGGRAYLGANLGWVRSCSSKTPIHEFGHNFGLGHADSTDTEHYSGYGDYSDFMGMQYKELNAAHRDQLGWIPTAKIQNITTATKANFKLASLSSTTGSSSYLQTLKFPHTDTGSQMYFSYRTADGSWDSSLSAKYKDLMNVHKRDSVYSRPTMHLESLDIGGVYTDTKTGITVEVLNKNADYMEVAVNGGSGGTSTVCSEVAPTISISTSNLSIAPGKTASRAFSVKNNNPSTCGAKVYNLSITDISGINGSLSKSSIGLASGASATITASAAVSLSKASGNYMLPIKATSSSDASKSDSDSLRVSVSSAADTEAPIVSISSPTGGSAFDIGATVSVLVAASDNFGVSSVQVWHEGLWHAATETSTGYVYSFKMTAGSLSIRASAKDAAGNMALSSFVSLAVKSTAPVDTTAPSISLTSPSNGLEIKAGDTISMTAAASDNVGVSKVNFYLGGVLKCVDSSAPYSCSTAMPTSSGVSVYARAYDAAGNFKNSSSATVKNPVATTVDTQAPTAPRSLSAKVKGKNNVNLSWSSASDNVGVAAYRVYKDGSYIGQTSSLSYQDSKSANGSHTYTVKALDAAGNLSSSSNSASATIGGDSTGGGKDGACRGKKCR